MPTRQCSRKHWIAFAKCIRFAEMNDNARKSITRLMAIEFRKDNSEFDEELFYYIALDNSKKPKRYGVNLDKVIAEGQSEIQSSN